MRTCFWILICSLFFVSCAPNHEKVLLKKLLVQIKSNNVDGIDRALFEILNSEFNNEEKIFALNQVLNFSMSDSEQFEKAVIHLEKIILLSNSKEEKIKYSYLLAEFLNSNLKSPRRSIKALNNLNELELSSEEKIQVSFKLAYYFRSLKNYYQEELELKRIVQNNGLKPTEEFSAYNRLSQSYFVQGKKKLAKEKVMFLKKKYPVSYQVEKLYMILVSLLIDEGAYAQAIDTLNEVVVKSESEKTRIERKISSIRSLNQNKPGSEGLRR